MRNKLANLFSTRPKKPSQAQTAETEDQLEVNKELQSLRMALEGLEQSNASLKQEIERLRERESRLNRETLATYLEGLFSELASPASQILTQAYLAENQGKPVQATDVLAVARRFISVMERHGAAFEGRIGELVPYDSDRHTPLRLSSALKPGHMVTIRFSGVSYQSKTVYKAIVE